MPSTYTMGLGKSLLNRGIRRLTTSTTPKTKAYSPTAEYGYNQKQQHERKTPVGDYVPIYVAVGMIALSVGFGVHTAWHQLRTSPTVSVRKQRRETLPEVVDPEHVAEESEKFLKGSFFRKVAHIQDKNTHDKKVMPDPIHDDVFAKGHAPKVVSLKSVGIDPSHV